MIVRLLPERVVAIEAYADRWETELLPEEQTVITRAVEKRRREFAAGRNCARRALNRLGWSDFPVLSGPNREPLWPAGVLGSITHCDGYCAAAAARLAELEGICGLGIDAEQNVPVPDGVVDLVCTLAEARSLVEAPGINVPTLVFSAKESVYKAWFPITGCWLNYQDAEIDLDLPGGRFGVRLLASAPMNALPAPTTFTGRFAITATHVFTLVTARMGSSATRVPVLSGVTAMHESKALLTRRQEMADSDGGLDATAGAPVGPAPADGVRVSAL